MSIPCVTAMSAMEWWLIEDMCERIGAEGGGFEEVVTNNSLKM